MAANNLLEMSRSLRLYVPQLPASLAEQFIRDRYRRILERRDWAALVREAEFHLNEMGIAGTVAITRGDTTVTGVGTAFAASDVGRQFKVGLSSPIYTITAVSTPTSMTIDRAYGGTTTASETYRIFDGYVTPPDNFLRFVTIIDPQLGWRLHHYVTAEELNTMDPYRINFGIPYMLVDRMYDSTGKPQYEAWPYASAARTLYYTYILRGDDLVNDEDTPIWPIRSDVIVQGALADAAKWPGTAEQPNPYFARPDLWKAYEAAFEDLMIEIERRDEDIYMRSLKYPMFTQFAPISANWMQSHVNY